MGHVSELLTDFKTDRLVVRQSLAVDRAAWRQHLHSTHPLASARDVNKILHATTVSSQAFRWTVKKMDMGTHFGRMPHARLNWTILDKVTGKFVGYIAATGEMPSGATEVGYWIAKDQRGKGYASEAFQALLGRLTNAGVKDVLATVNPKNAASIKILEKAGLKKTKPARISRSTLRRPQARHVYRLER